MTTPYFNLQPDFLEDEITKLVPLKESDFEELYKVASDPLIWEQHPMKDRYKKEVFQSFFEAAINSKGSFLILDKQTNEIMGTTRYYDYNPEKSSVAIGYTFISRKYWGGPYNNSTKKLLIDYAFQHVDSILFHIGAENFRSQKAVSKLGAVKINTMVVSSNGINIPHFEYLLSKK
ncbi:GNAT family N-acetyltransferase [Flavobacterium sp.]|uniref:GNAT family N-acetyltransferase n=1 Tax=Flavobacterium sp. TaxID=239 RepID=UPI0031E1B725